VVRIRVLSLLLLLRLSLMGKECRWNGREPWSRTRWHHRGSCESSRQRRQHASRIAAAC
jgi:hypothetical protein